MPKSKVKCESCKELCGVGKAPVESVRRLEVLYRKLLKCGPENPLLKYLTKNIFNAIKMKRTAYKMTLLECIQSALGKFEGPYDSLGLFAADPECYDVFEALFSILLKDQYDFKEEDEHPESDFGEDPNALGNIDPTGNNVISTRLRCCRSLKGYPFNAGLTEEQYTEIEEKIEAVVLQFPENLQGQYRRLSDISEAEMKKLRKDHILFKEGDEFVQSAKVCEFWPVGRGYFSNAKKTLLVWVNEKDHIRIISMQKGGNLGEIYLRLVNVLTELDQKLKFVRHEKYGFLSSSPNSLGTAIKASVHISLPNLGKDLENLVKVVDRNGLQARGIDCELSDTKTGTFDLSSKKSIGLTEYQMLQEFGDAVKAVIKEEKEKK